MFFNLGQTKNIYFPMVVTELGIETDLSERQHSKARFLMVVTESGTNMEVSLVQPENADSRMVVTGLSLILAGISKWPDAEESQFFMKIAESCSINVSG